MSVGGVGISTFTTTQELNYEAVQVGADVGVLNMEGSGWNAHFGVTGGLVRGDVAQVNGADPTDFDVPSVGAYTFVTDGAFSLDVWARQDFQQFEFTNAAAGLVDHEVDGDATTLAAAAAYRIGLGGAVYFTPSAAINWTRSDIDSFDIIGGTIATGSDTALVGRFGGQLSTIQQISPNAYMQPFFRTSLWKNFENETDLTFLAQGGGGVVPVNVETVGVDEFWQFSGGVSGYNPVLGFAGYVRATWNEGDDISGYEFSAGGRFELN